MASSVEILCAREDTGFRLRRRPRHKASTEGSVLFCGCRRCADLLDTTETVQMPLHSCWLRLDPRCLLPDLFWYEEHPQFSCVPDVAAIVARGLVDWCSWLPLLRRNAPRCFPLYFKPKASCIRSFTSALAPHVTLQVRKVVTCLPAMLAVEGEDPWNVIRFVNATRDLKDVRFPERAGKACLTALLPLRRRRELLHERLSMRRPGVHYCARGRVWISFASCWIAVFLCNSRWVRHKTKSIHIQCDSSPIAVQELFGMLVDIWISDMRWVERCHIGVTMGPRTHGLPMHAGEFAVGSMVDHGAQDGFVRRRASAHQVFHNGPRCEGLDGVGEHWGNVEFSQCSGTQPPQDAHGLTFPFAVHAPDRNNTIMNTSRNHRVLALVSGPNAQLDDLIPKRGLQSCDPGLCPNTGPESGSSASLFYSLFREVAH